ncbi:MAG: hypothetical protein NUV57_03145 [archaeon]|nr:hypothetical protein [archaeon]
MYEPKNSIEPSASITEKIPFFPYSIILAALIVIGLLGFVFLTIDSEPKTEVTIEVLNNAGVPLRGVEVTVFGENLNLKINTDKDGKTVFEAPIGKQVEISASKSGYGDKTKSVKIQEGTKVGLVLSAPLFASKDITLTFVDPDSQKLVGKQLNVQLACTGSANFSQEEQIVTQGELVTEPPLGCDTVTVTTSADGYETSQITVLGKEEIIKLQKIQAPSGSVQIVVKELDTNRFLDGMEVKLVDIRENVTGNQTYTSFGEAKFSGIQIGTYSAIVEDPNSEYGSERILFEVNQNKVNEKTVYLTKQLQLTAKIKAEKKNSSSGIEGVTVTLYDLEGLVVGEKETDSKGEAIFAIREKGSYSFKAAKENYLPGDTEVINTSKYAVGSAQEFKTKMEQCTPTRCGSLTIRVIDEDGIPISNAEVMLLDEEGFVETAYGIKVTDFNGVIEPFLNVAEGTYSALAQKYPVQGTYNTIEVNPLEENFVEMTVIVGNGTIIVNAIDDEGDPIEFGDAEIYTDYGEQIGVIRLDGDGTGIISEIKADKSVYAIVKKSGFTSYFTTAKQVIKDRTVSFNVILEKEILGNSPTIEFLGVYSKQEREVRNLASGNTYFVRFLVTVPTQVELDDLGVFFRAGEKETLEKDDIGITKTNVPLASVIRGQTFKPLLGETELTNGRAKWVSMVFDNPESGKYEIELEIKIEDGTTPGTFLPLYYRTWGTEESVYLRDPFDRTLGEARETETKKGIYAEAYQKPFYEGMDELCSGDFCFAHRLLDKTEDLYINEPYNVKTFTPYTLEFSLTNNSPIIYDTAELLIKNSDGTPEDIKDISIESYSFSNADSQEFTGNTPAFKIQALSMGDFRQNKNVSGKLGIESKSDASSALEFKIISDQLIAYESFVIFNTFFNEQIKINVLPEELVAYIPIDLNVIVTAASEEADGFRIDGAKIIVTKIAPDRSETKFVGTTNYDGMAEIIIPASEPGTKLVITAEKPGLGITEVIKEVEGGVAKFNPKEIEVSLNTQTKEEDTTILNIENKINKPIVIKKIITTGKFYGLIDERRIDNFLTSYVGTIIDKKSVSGIEVLSALGSDAEYLSEGKILEGKLIITLALEENPEISWIHELPFNTIINLAELPANDSCIVLSKKTWRDSTISSRSSLEFEVKNNCVSEDGRPIELKNLQGKIGWIGKDGIVGQVELSITDPDSGQIASEILQENLWSRFTESLRPGIVYPARLTFVPKPDTLGKTGEFIVEIDAELLTNAGRQFVGASNSIDGEILIVNLDQCIQITPDPQTGIEISETETTGEFTIDTSQCGPIDIDFRFCNGGTDQCRGGAPEGGITVTPWTLNNVQEESKEVRVDRQIIPGFYGITVEARPKGGSWRKITEVNAVIRPREGSYFEMNKYNFNVIGIGSEDSAIVTNNMLLEDVEVKASICDWDEAKKEDDFAGRGLEAAAVGAGVGAVSGTLLGVTVLAGHGVGPAIAGLAFCPPCAVIGSVIAVVVALLYIIFTATEDPCDEDHSDTLKDYVINLAGSMNLASFNYIPPDALAILVSDRSIRGNWNTGVTDSKGDRGIHGWQEVGMKFKNVNAEQDEPVYAIVTASAREHVHGDPTHTMAKVTCKGSNFGMFKINPGECGTPFEGVYNTVYTQKFHVKFKVSEEIETLPLVNFDTLACQSGNNIGRTSSGALPRIKLNWSWNESRGGISETTCDASNPDYVYCDATQFTIEINKRMYNLYELLEKNSFNLSCPQVVIDLKDVAMSALAQEIGSSQLLTATVNGLTEANGLDETDTTIASDNIMLKLMMDQVLADQGYDQQFDCTLKTTETYQDIPNIIWYAQANSNMKWTEKIPDKDALFDTLVFDAYLIKDNYSDEFYRDFSDYYTNQSFEDTPEYFTSLGVDKQGKEYGINRLMDEGLFKVTRKYVESSELPGAGLYRVDIAAYFNDNDWRFFDSDGKPRVATAIVVYKKDDPFPNSPFYSLPLDGLVGVRADETLRANYGTTYIVSNDEVLPISNELPPAKTYPDAGSNAIATAQMEINRNLYQLNTSPATRGMILQIDKPTGRAANIIFQPTQATPVLMKVSKDGLTEESFGAFYSMLEGDVPLDIGNTVSYWNGAGVCRDFTGVPVTEAFYEKPDRKAAAEDNLIDYQHLYALDWEKADLDGEVYLRTIIYSDPLSDTILKAQDSKTKVNFYTADESGQVVGLNGVSGMRYNNFASGSEGMIDSIEDVFTMVQSGDVCVTNNGNSTKFWWNPQTIYTEKGRERSISELTNSLEAGNTCIG